MPYTDAVDNAGLVTRNYKGKRKIKGNLRKLSDAGNINRYSASTLFFFEKRKGKKGESKL